MKLHENKKEFKKLIKIVAKNKNLPKSAVERDYYIVLLLKNLEESEYVNQCVFKGGTSLSKCYPGSIERFSEDIDLTFLGMDKSDKYCDKVLKKIEKAIIKTANYEKINDERTPRNKSSYVWFNNKDNRIKLEIGSSVRPEPYSKRKIKSYIHEYLEVYSPLSVEKYEFKEISLNVLNVERTFIDKIMAIKRHALCNSLKNKVRHIYDVVRLFDMHEIQEFLLNKDEVKKIIQLTKKTDSHYLQKRNIPEEYNPLASYDLEGFKYCFNDEIRNIYENMHNSLLYTNEKQDFDKAMKVLEKINNILKEINE